jgi:hypothetical protein
MATLRRPKSQVGEYKCAEEREKLQAPTVFLNRDRHDRLGASIDFPSSFMAIVLSLGSLVVGLLTRLFGWEPGGARWSPMDNPLEMCSIILRSLESART